MQRRTIIAMTLSLGLLTACGGDAQSSTGAASSSTGPSAPAATSGGKPSSTAPTAANAPEEQVDKELVTCVWTKKTAEEWGEQTPEFECTSAAPRDMKYVQFEIYYYDKDKKILNNGYGMPSAKNAPVVIKAGETKKFALGKAKKDLPPGTEYIQAEVSAGAYTDAAKWRNPKLGLPDRKFKE